MVAIARIANGSVARVLIGKWREMLVDGEPLAGWLSFEYDRLSLRASRRLAVERQFRLYAVSEDRHRSGELNVAIAGAAAAHAKAVALFPQCPFGLVFGATAQRSI